MKVSKKWSQIKSERFRWPTSAAWQQELKGWLPIAKLKKIYKDRLDSGVTWLKWLPHSMEQYGRLAPKSNKVNYQKLTLYFKKISQGLVVFGCNLAQLIAY